MPIDKLLEQTLLKIPKTIPAVNTFISCEKAAQETLKYFIENKLNSYAEKRNDPNTNAVSNLSPYLHFGQIFSGDIALQVMSANANEESKKSLLEELIVRKELSDNFCFYNENYDNALSSPDWAKKDCEIHRNDEREYLYKLEDFEKAQTHDPLWNAAQKEIVKTGKMHGYMHMYWAKKIMEWTPSPEEAWKIAIY